MKSKKLDIPHSELVRNLVVVGATGAGKSTTCNTLYGLPDGPFAVGHDEVSYTERTSSKVNETKRIRIIDTPDFRDNRYDARRIDDLRKGVASIFVDPRIDSTKQVDAFLLVVKLNPRISTLHDDLERLRNLFGIIVLRSVILLVINHDGIDELREDFLDTLSELEQVTKMFKEAKNEEPNENWFCYWDNKNPIPGQEEELFEKIKKLEPYTHERFIEGQKEAKQRLHIMAQLAMDNEIERIRNKYIVEAEIMAKQIVELDMKLKKERQELVEARDKALANVNQVLDAMKVLEENASKGIDNLYKEMAKEREEAMQRSLDIMKTKETGYGQTLADFMRQNNEILDRFKFHVGIRTQELKGLQEAEDDKNFGEHVHELIDGNLSEEEKKRALRETARKGAETIVKKGAEEMASKTAEEMAKIGAEKLVRTGLKFAATRFCNQF